MADTMPAIRVGELRPALASIQGAIAYLGKPSRSKFYADILPELKKIKIGTRTMVVVASLDNYIASRQQAA